MVCDWAGTDRHFVTQSLSLIIMHTKPGSNFNQELVMIRAFDPTLVQQLENRRGDAWTLGCWL